MKSALVLVYFANSFIEESTALRIATELQEMKQQGYILLVSASTRQVFKKLPAALNRELFYNAYEYMPLKELMKSEWGFNSLYIVGTACRNIMISDVSLLEDILLPRYDHTPPMQHAS